MSSPAPPASSAAPPPVAWGKTSTLGTVLTVLASIAGIISASNGNDSATVASGIITALLGATTIGGRMAQAVAIARSAAVTAGPFIDAIQAALAATPASLDVDREIARSRALGIGERVQAVMPPDADDSSHALTDGNPSTQVAASPADLVDETLSAPDPEGDQ